MSHRAKESAHSRLPLRESRPSRGSPCILSPLVLRWQYSCPHVKPHGVGGAPNGASPLSFPWPRGTDRSLPTPFPAAASRKWSCRCLFWWWLGSRSWPCGISERVPQSHADCDPTLTSFPFHWVLGELWLRMWGLWFAEWFAVLLVKWKSRGARWQKAAAEPAWSRMQLALRLSATAADSGQSVMVPRMLRLQRWWGPCPAR